MIPDIGKIVASYTEPYGLRNLFIQHNLDFNMAFKYDASKYVIELNKLKCIFNYFSKIILTGLSIWASQSFVITNITTNIGSHKCTTIQKLLIISYDRYAFPIINIQGLDKYSNLYLFRTRFCKIKNTNVLINCPHITHLDLYTCPTDGLIPSKSLQNLIMCGFEQTIKQIGIDVIDYPKLQHFYGSPKNWMTMCPTLKSLAMHQQIRYDLTFFPNLEFLYVYINCSLMDNIERYKWHHIKHIIIKCTNIDAKIFESCSNLITVELYCEYVHNINSLTNQPNINLKISSRNINIHRFKYGPTKSFRKYMKLYKDSIDYMFLTALGLED